MQIKVSILKSCPTLAQILLSYQQFPGPSCLLAFAASDYNSQPTSPVQSITCSCLLHPSTVSPIMLNATERLTDCQSNTMWVQTISNQVLYPEPSKGRWTCKKSSFGGDEYVYGIDQGDGFTNVYLSPKLVKLYTLNMFSLLYVNHASISVFF